nr:MAG TPA: hypothetical protein [Caudoviricetes sp.]
MRLRQVRFLLLLIRMDSHYLIISIKFRGRM